MTPLPPQQPAATAANPVLVEITRGPLVESRHRGAAAVVNAAGETLLALGDVDAVVYPRSAVKFFQALPLLESGAADGYGFTPVELALACASHNGEDAHLETLRGMLAKAGLAEAELACGLHWPTSRTAAAALNRAGGRPGPGHNNCSGKHAGMLAAAKWTGAPTTGYTEADHPIQQRIIAALGQMAGLELADAPRERDGCSVPTWALPLRNLARAFAVFAANAAPGATAAAGETPPTRATACARLFRAVADNPFMIAGTRRYCTEMTAALQGRAVVKLGAEGVYCAMLPVQGLGIAVKCDDGAARGAERIMTALLQKTGVLDAAAAQRVPHLTTPEIKNLNGYLTGGVRITAGFGL